MGNMWVRIGAMIVTGTALIGGGAGVLELSDKFDSSFLVALSMAIILMGVAVLIRGFVEVFKN